MGILGRAVYKGLRYGDPLSPFFSFWQMEGLTQMLSKAKELQWIKGFQVGSNPIDSISVTYLLYADDTLIFWMLIDLKS